MAAANPNFLNVWGNDKIRTTLLSHLDDDSLCSLRLTNSECCKLSTATLFMRMHLTFTPSALTRPSRMEALGRIGHHIQHLTFSMPHNEATFLPPLLNPVTGQEVVFLYNPHTSVASESHRPKYGTQALGDVLTQQYPPIFHAATNVPAFIRTFSCLPKLRHLTITCPGQNPTQRYRRDAVDYALISLRIAIERAYLPKLSKLSLSIHPSALLYFRSQPGFGASPASSRRWKQIRKLKLTVDAWDFNGPRPGLDHLKIIDDYIRSFSANLEKVSFTWNGLSGPCPFTLFTSPVFAPPRKAGKLFAEVTSPMSPLPAAPTKADIFFPKLRYMQVRNCLMRAPQVADLVYAHRHSVREYDFEKVSLLDDGTWEEALEPLTRMSGSEAWHSSQTSSSASGSGSSSESEGYKTCTSQGAPDSAIDMTNPWNSDAGQCLPDSGIERNSVLTTRIKKRRIRRRRKVKEDIDPIPIPSSPRLGVSLPVMSTSTVFTKPYPPSPGLGVSSHIMSSSTIFAQPPPPSPLPMLQPKTFMPSADIQGVQRDASLDLSRQALADDAEKRTSTLRKAREAVLTRLGTQFSKQRNDSRENLKGFFNRKVGAMGGNMGVEKGSQLVPLMIFR